jgi:hypothetical protein
MARRGQIDHDEQEHKRCDGRHGGLLMRRLGLRKPVASFKRVSVVTSEPAGHAHL